MSQAEEAEIYASASLYVTSYDLTPKMISEQLGLQPTRTIPSGERLLERHPYRDPSHYFVLEVSHRGKRTSDDSAAGLLQKAIGELLLKIESVAGKLDQVRDRVSVSLMCAFGSTRNAELFVLPDPLLQRIATLRLGLTLLLIPVEEKRD